MKFAARALILLACAAVLPTTALAQSTIAGSIVDDTGGVLPGVTVEASSDVLIEGSRVAVTNGAGQYTIVDLRPGTYTVTFTLAGFRHPGARRGRAAGRLHAHAGRRDGGGPGRRDHRRLGRGARRRRAARAARADPDAGGRRGDPVRGQPVVVRGPGARRQAAPSRHRRIPRHAAEPDVRAWRQLAADHGGSRRHERQHVQRRRPVQAVPQPADDLGGHVHDHRHERRDRARRPAHEHHSARGWQLVERIGVRRRLAPQLVVRQLERAPGSVGGPGTRRRAGAAVGRTAARSGLRLQRRHRRTDRPGPALVLRYVPRPGDRRRDAQRDESRRHAGHRRQPHQQRHGASHLAGRRQPEVVGLSGPDLQAALPPVRAQHGSAHRVGHDRAEHQLLHGEHEVHLDREQPGALRDGPLAGRAGPPQREPARDHGPPAGRLRAVPVHPLLQRRPAAGRVRGSGRPLVRQHPPPRRSAGALLLRRRGARERHPSLQPELPGLGVVRHRLAQLQGRGRQQHGQADQRPGRQRRHQRDALWQRPQPVRPHRAPGSVRITSTPTATTRA